jgi:hypothetical protein
MSETADNSMTQGLQRFLAGELDEKAARDLVAQAGTLMDKSTIPELKAIAEITSAEANRKITLLALHSLWQLDEPLAYFVANAQDHDHNKWLAYYSILILGREPNVETISVLSQIKDATPDSHIRSAVAAAERVQYLAAEYAKLTTPEQQCAYLLAHFRGSWNPISQGEGELDSVMSPQAAWSQRALFDLSDKHPALVAQAVAQLDLSGDYSDEYFTKSYREYVAGFLAPAAYQQFRQLVGATEAP